MSEASRRFERGRLGEATMVSSMVSGYRSTASVTSLRASAATLRPMLTVVTLCEIPIHRVRGSKVAYTESLFSHPIAPTMSHVRALFIHSCVLCRRVKISKTAPTARKTKPWDVTPRKQQRGGLRFGAGKLREARNMCYVCADSACEFRLRRLNRNSQTVN